MRRAACRRPAGQLSSRRTIALTHNELHLHQATEPRSLIISGPSFAVVPRHTTATEGT
jgi:hypothetical protein